MQTIALTKHIIYNIALIGIGGYLITRISAIRRTVTQSQYSLQDKLVLGVIFGAFSAIGNWVGIPILGAIANHRIVGPIAGGLLGGPLVGLIAGILGAIPRYFIGGFTVWPSVISNIIVGLFSGWVHKKYGVHKINLKVAMITALIGEGILKFMILAFAKPFEAAWQLEQVIGIPTILANVLAVVFFVYIVQDVFREQEKVQALSAQQCLRMIKQTNSFVSQGITEQTAFEVAQIIHKETGAAAVAVTDTSKVLAFVGEGADHHTVGTPIVTAVTKQVVRNRQTVIVRDRKSIGCPYPKCRLSAVIDAPILVGGDLVGTIKLYKANQQTVTSFEVELIQGIADLLSFLMVQQKWDQQQRLLLEIEYNMLKAQINPHFFFNTLGTIQAFVQVDPQQATSLIKDLADFFRRTLKRDKEIVPLHEELESLRTYIRIEQKRFGSRLKIIEAIPDYLLEHPTPVFSIQPLVENAIRHGLSQKKTGGTIQISAWHDAKSVYIRIEDDGVGIEEDRLAAIVQFDSSAPSTTGIGIGLTNVYRRVKAIYGKRASLTVKSRQHQGTVVTVRLPFQFEKEALPDANLNSRYC